MKNILFAFYCLFTPLYAYAQNQNPVCPSDFWRQTHLQNLDFQHSNEVFEQDVLDVFQNKKGHQGVPEQIRTVPVVVHIIHDNGPENLSDAEIQQAIQWLNQALSNQGIFDQGSGANTEIQLCLAQRTPAGGATNGITRDQNALTEMQMETQDLALKNLNRWEPKDYLNIWLLRSICSITYGCNVYGYANYPFAHGSSIDGIVIEAAYLTSSDKIRGLAHETGHYFGLYHTFEGGCTNNNCLTDGDRICDTPPDQSTVGIPCSESVNTCSTDLQSGPFSTDQPDMTWNYMDYGHLECFHDFTPDQSTRINTALDGKRHSLLESKGCLPPCPGNPVASFLSSDTIISIGGTINFQSTSQQAATYQWSINGISFSDQDAASYVFNAPGTYNVQLYVESSTPDLCEPDSTTLKIQVICPVQADFSLSNPSPEQNDTVQIIDHTQNATQTEWFLNGVSLGNTPHSIVFASVGPNQLQLIAGNGFCADTITKTVYVYGFCVQKTFELSIGDEYFPDINTLGNLIQLTDGNLLMQYFGTDSPGESPILCKITPYGKVLWTKRAVGPDSLIQPQALIKPAVDNGFFMLRNRVGWTGVQEGFILEKFNPDGNFLWGKQLNIEDQNLINILDFTNDSNGFLIALSDRLIKLDATGQVEWVRRGFSPKKLHLFPDGNCLVLEEAGISRLDGQGNPVWRRHLNPPPIGATLQGLIATPGGNIFISGTITLGPPNQPKGYLIKLDETGQTIWAKYYREIAVSKYDFSKIVLTSDGNLAVAGPCQADAPGVGLGPYLFIGKLDTNGVLLWARHYSKPYAPIDLCATTGGGLAIAFQGNINAAGEQSYRMLKTDGEGLLRSACFEDPHTLNTYNYALVNGPEMAALMPDTLHVIPFANALVNIPWTVDTICDPSCQIAYEICDNNIDDDGDGLFDCLDTECSCSFNHCNPRYYDKWYFGDKAGIDFGANPPKLLAGGQTALNEGYSTICDPSGNLLFYTDGLNVFNRLHSIMPEGAFSTPFNGLIVPHPAKPSEYYLFSVRSDGVLSYSVIDITLDDGRGDIDPNIKDVPLDQNCNGPAAVVACDFQGYWLVTLKGNKQFLAFRIDQNGLKITPVISTTTQDVWLPNQIKISQDGANIACTGVEQSTGKAILMLYDFNAGTVLNPQLIESFPSPNQTTGVEFSPNNRFLYCSGTFPGDYKIRQYDLQAGNATAIRNSAVAMAQIPGAFTGLLQLAPNGKIYGTTNVNNSPLGFKLDVINAPDLGGLDCQYQHEGFDLSGLFPPGGTVYFRLPNSISGTNLKPHIAFSGNARDTICYLNVVYLYELKKLPCTVDSVHWQISELDVSYLPAGTKIGLQFNSPGKGKLIALVYTPCGVATDTLDIYVNTPGPAKIDLGPDITVCQNGVFTLHAGSGFARYLWSDNTADSTTTTLQPGQYWVKAWDACGNLYSDTIQISVAPNSVLDLGEIPVQCPGFTQSFQRPAGFTSWQWAPADFLNCTNCPLVTVAPDQNTSWTILATTADGCISVDTLQVFIRDTLPIQLDTFVCANLQLNLFGATLPPDTTAQFFFPRAGATCDTLWTVNVMPQDNPLGTIDVTICSDAYFNFHGMLLPADTTVLAVVSQAGECDSLITITIHAYPELSLQLPQDTTIKIGASVLLETQISGANPFSLQWTPAESLSCSDCPDPLAGPLDTLTYFLSVTDANGCTGSESVTLRVQEICRVQVPNAFSPNGDGANDIFRPICDPCVKTVLSWRIFNRWGQNVFSQFNFPPTDLNLGWDGSDQDGKAQASDVYIWTLEVEYYDGRRESRQNQVNLIR